MQPRHLTPADWQDVYDMERELWGRTFDHLGAPLPDSQHSREGRRRYYAAQGWPLSGIGYENVEATARRMMALNETRERQYL